MFGLNLSTGLVLLCIGLGAEWMIKRKIPATKGAAGAGSRSEVGSARLIRAYSWIAWTFALLGSALMSEAVGNPFGLSPKAAVLITVLGCMLVAVDLLDRRPDWPAFLIIAALPFVARIPRGSIGVLFHVVLGAAAQIAHAVGSVLGA